jgi:hypothetical protein
VTRSCSPQQVADNVSPEGNFKIVISAPLMYGASLFTLLAHVNLGGQLVMFRVFDAEVIVDASAGYDFRDDFGASETGNDGEMNLNGQGGMLVAPPRLGVIAESIRPITQGRTRSRTSSYAATARRCSRRRLSRRSRLVRRSTTRWSPALPTSGTAKRSPRWCRSATACRPQEELSAFLRESLADYKVPKVIVDVPEIRRPPAGKVVLPPGRGAFSPR